LAYSDKGVRPGRLEMERALDGATQLLVLRGELDADACPKVEFELAQAEASDADRIVVDLSQVEFIDSTGIALLVSALRRSEQNSCRLRFVPSHSEDVQRLLELCGLDGHLPLAGE
jgi:anti-sigma B factor antagonist